MSDFGLQYGSQKRAATGQRDATLAQNAYSRFLSQKRGSRGLADLERGMSQGVGKMAAGFGQRGLGQSGLWGEAQSNYGQQWMQQRQDINDEITSGLRQADLGDAGAWSDFYGTDADIEARKASDIMQTASTLDSFRPFLGS